MAEKQKENGNNENSETKLSDEDQQFLAKIDGITNEVTENLTNLYVMVAKFNQRFRAKKIPKQKLNTLKNAVDRLAANLGEDDPNVKGLRKDLAASELATNEVGEVFNLEKKLRTCVQAINPEFLEKAKEKAKERKRDSNK